MCIRDRLEDELMRLFGGERMQSIVDRVGLDDEAIEAKMLSRSIAVSYTHLVSAMASTGFFRKDR